MKGEQIVALRERMGLSRGDLAELLNNALGTRNRADAIARWEDGRRNPSAAASAFLDELELRTGLEALEGAPQPTGAAETLFDPPQDVPPAPGFGDTYEAQAPALTGSPLLVKACTELVEMVSMTVGSVGALLGSPALERDGQIIYADRDALGQAWGRLAETNETFRRMLTSTLAGGAWMQVVLVTGTTASKCYHSHAEYRAARQAEAAMNGHGGEQLSVDESLAA